MKRPITCPKQEKRTCARGQGSRTGLILTLSLNLFCSATVFSIERTLVATGSVWKYLDVGIEPTSNWTSSTFDDSAWPEGRAQFGYGDGDEATTINFGPDLQAKYITSYFRQLVVLTNAHMFDQLTVRVLRDDGMIIHLNGVEIFRNNLPLGPVEFTTLAQTNVVGEDSRGPQNSDH
jgi:hypothetical protein